MKTDYVYPDYWNKGQLLDVRGWTDGSYLVRALDEPPELLKAIANDPDNNKRGEISFPDAHTCQNFVSWWYDRGIGR